MKTTITTENDVVDNTTSLTIDEAIEFIANMIMETAPPAALVHIKTWEVALYFAANISTQYISMQKALPPSQFPGIDEMVRGPYFECSLPLALTRIILKRRGLDEQLEQFTNMSKSAEANANAAVKKAKEGSGCDDAQRGMAESGIAEPPPPQEFD